ncbi:hypothetical protein Tco_1303408 [Tanacetum coccineum]
METIVASKPKKFAREAIEMATETDWTRESVHGERPAETNRKLENHFSIQPEPTTTTKQEGKTPANGHTLWIRECEDFIAYCDASKKGLGAVLMQREKVISCAASPQILNAQTEARKPENIKSEDVGGMLVENAKFPEAIR